MNAPTQAPADWRSRYGFDQGPSPESQAYWALNSGNANLVNHGVNNMPFVMNPAALFNHNPASPKSPEEIKGMMYKPAQAPQQGAPIEHLLGIVQQNPEALPFLIDQNPELMPMLMRQFGGGATPQIPGG